MAGALDGIRVVDFGQYIAGPLTGMLLADQGADVIHVQPPSGPAWDTPVNVVWDRGKRGIALDLKRGEDVEVARRLIGTADVVVENFRPAVMERLGLGAEEMTRANPALVYCSLPGFAADDPRAGMPAYEGVIKAATGTYRRNREGEPPGAPVYTALPIASTFAAQQAAIAIGMALVACERDGVGQRVTVPLYDAMFAAIGYQGITQHNPPPRGAAGGIGIGGAFLCKDNRYLYFGTGNGNLTEVIDALGIQTWVADGLFDRAKVAADPSLRDELRTRARALFATRDAEEWEALISAAGGEGAVCRDAREWLRHPAALESGIVIERDDPRLGRTLQPGLAVSLSATPGEVRAPAPQLDGDHAEILAELPTRSAPRYAATSTPVEALRPILDGMRVLDLCIVLAGPTAGRTLAEYGADVIKIEAPTRPPSALFHLDVNRGKRSIVLDLKEPAGLELFWKLVEDADVVVQNFRNGVAERLGVGYEQVRARKPDIVYASLNMYGQLGKLAERPGHEQFAQAATGMQARYGAGGAPQLQRLAITDYGTGYLGAYAIALALLHRARTGEGQHVATSLSHTATLAQSPFMLDYAEARWDEPAGQDALGDGPLHRAYAASDGWFWFGAHPRELARLGALLGIAHIEALSDSALIDALAHRFAAEPVAAWVTTLAAAECSVSPYVHDLAALMAEPWVVEHGLSITREHGARGAITHPGPPARLSRTPLVPGRPTPEIGADNLDVLRELGLAGRAEELAPVMTARGGVADAG